MRLFALFLIAGLAFAAPLPRVFPAPQQMELQPGSFVFDESVRIVLADDPTENDKLVARLLTTELSDWYGVAVRSDRDLRSPAKGRLVVMGEFNNLLVARHLTRLGLQVSQTEPGPEGYILSVTPDLILIAGRDPRGTFYGLQSLRQLITKSGDKAAVPCLRIRDWPRKPFRAFRLYLPSREDMPYFKKLVRDVLALYKYNALILEVNGAVRLDRHPEVNAGWLEFAKDLSYSRRDRPTGPHGEYVDSGNADTANGRVLEKDEVAEMLRWIRQFHMDVIPQLPSLTHSFYLLTRHRELAEMPDWEWPDAYCPSNPKSYELLFDVYDEYIDLFKPTMVDIGHDEWRCIVGTCPRCRSKRPVQLYAEDVNKIHDYLAKKKIRTALWGDHLMESMRGKGVWPQKTQDGYRYVWPGALSPEEVKALIPKDIFVFNWAWGDGKAVGEESDRIISGEQNIKLIEDLGFEQALGNLETDFETWGKRTASPRVVGGAVSSWSLTGEFVVGKDMMHDVIGSAGLMWSSTWASSKEVQSMIQQAYPAVRRYLTGEPPASQEGDPIAAFNLAPVFNSAQAKDLGVDLAGKQAAVIKNGENAAITIPLGADPSSLIFQHACARPARNDMGYRYVYNMDDTADLLGFYEIVYADGFITTVPIRYGVNILELNWKQSRTTRSQCYNCDPVEAPGSATFFSFEWKNPRFGKVIKEVRLKTTSGFIGTSGRPIRENAILLGGLSQVVKRTSPEPGSARTFVEQK